MPCMSLSTSVKMVELHCRHINPALKAQEIAGKRHVPRVPAVEANARKENSKLVKPIKTSRTRKNHKKSSVT
jgi:hypothetical protein